MTSPPHLEIGDLWLHGTTHYFERWASPPILTLPSQALIPHSFVSLSADLIYAQLHMGLHGRICSARLLPKSRILDLRVRSDDSLLLWKKVRSTSLGAKYYGLRSAEEWFMACRTGSVLRFVFSSENDNPELFAQQKIAESTTSDNILKSNASIYIQNFTRRWIETLIGPIKSMGYDAVICNELERSINTEASSQLFVFNVECLSEPDWITLPSISNLNHPSDNKKLLREI
jgi:hypothetical protein